MSRVRPTASVAAMPLGCQLRIGHKRVWRLLPIAGLQGVYRRRWRHSQPAAAVWEDRAQRRFHADRPDKLWCTDITQHCTAEGWVYCAVVLDVFSRRVMGWSIADHLRTELVVDALQMAAWRRRPNGTVVHSDRGTRPGEGGGLPFARRGPELEPDLLMI